MCTTINLDHLGRRHPHDQAPRAEGRHPQLASASAPGLWDALLG